MTSHRKSRQQKTMQPLATEERQDYIESLTQAEKAGLVDKEYILSKFVECVEGVGVFAGCKPPQLLRALERLGDFKKMFIKEAKLDINLISKLISDMPVGHLETIIEAEVVGGRNDQDTRPALGSGSEPRVQPSTTRSGRSVD